VTLDCFHICPGRSVLHARPELNDAALAPPTWMTAPCCIWLVPRSLPIAESRIQCRLWLPTHWITTSGRIWRSAGLAESGRTLPRHAPIPCFWSTFYTYCTQVRTPRQPVSLHNTPDFQPLSFRLDKVHGIANGSSIWNRGWRICIE
jgi:hypothetical protein